jgi:hypothetical protein
LGNIRISKLQLTDFSQLDISEADRKNFYLYIDEFQNFISIVLLQYEDEIAKYYSKLPYENAKSIQ